MAKNPRRVAVVHGRNLEALEGTFSFLRALDLQPVTWRAAIKETGQGSPTTREVLDALFQTTQAVVVLLTGDEDASLVPALRRDPGDDRTRTQARPNVWIEAGMALGVNRERTIFVRFGAHDEPSDIHGIQYVPFAGTSEQRHELRQRLETAKCAVTVDSDEWLRAGQAQIEKALAIESARADPDVSAAKTPGPGVQVLTDKPALWARLRPSEQKLLRRLVTADLAVLIVQLPGEPERDPFAEDLCDAAWVQEKDGIIEHEATKIGSSLRADLHELEQLGFVQRRRDYPVRGEGRWELSRNGRELLDWYRRSQPVAPIAIPKSRPDPWTNR